jgi:hypothetical protein
MRAARAMSKSAAMGSLGSPFIDHGGEMGQYF